jgi:hypothetical protein
MIRSVPGLCGPGGSDQTDSQEIHNGYEDSRGVRRVCDGVCVARGWPGLGQRPASVGGLRPVR